MEVASTDVGGARCGEDYFRVVRSTYRAVRHDCGGTKDCLTVRGYVTVGENRGAPLLRTVERCRRCGGGHTRIATL